MSSLKKSFYVKVTTQRKTKREFINYLYLQMKWKIKMKVSNREKIYSKTHINFVIKI